MANELVSAHELQAMVQARIKPLLKALQPRACIRAKAFTRTLDRYKTQGAALKAAKAYGERWRVEGDGSWLDFFKEIIPLILPLLIK